MLAVAADVTDRAAVDAMAAAALETYGRIDILAANAGVYRWDPIAEITDEVWDRIIDTNVKGAFHSIQAVLPAMRSQSYGRIVLTSSITGALVVAPGLAHYAASKAAMIGLMRSAALETVTDGITVNAVQPGNVRTAGLAHIDPELLAAVERSIPLGRLAEPEEVGWVGAVLRLGGGRVRHRTVARDRRRPGPAGSRRLIASAWASTPARPRADRVRRRRAAPRPLRGRPARRDHCVRAAASAALLGIPGQSRKSRAGCVRTHHARYGVRARSARPGSGAGS